MPEDEKKALVLTQSKEQQHCKSFPWCVLRSCGHLLLPLLFYPALCATFPVFLSLALCSHLPPLNWAASGRFLTFEVFILIFNNSETSMVSFTHSLFPFFLYFLLTPLFLSFSSSLLIFFFSFFLPDFFPSLLLCLSMSLPAFELLRSFPSPASLPSKEGRRQLLAEQRKELTSSGMSLALQALLS